MCWTRFAKRSVCLQTTMEKNNKWFRGMDALVGEIVWVSLFLVAMHRKEEKGFGFPPYFHIRKAIASSCQRGC